MASIKAGCIDKQTLILDDFIPEPSGMLLDMYEVDLGSFILVTEILNNEINYVFFDAYSRQKIERQSRFDSEDGKTDFIDIDEHKKGISTVSVNIETGFESIEERVVEEGEVIYKSRRERYPKIETLDLRERYRLFVVQEQKNKLRCENFINTFNHGDFDSKVSLLLGLFRKEWRTRSQLGFEQPELFLDKELVLKLDRDPSFRKALRKVLEVEQPVFDYNIESVYQNILSA